MCRIDSGGLFIFCRLIKFANFQEIYLFLGRRGRRSRSL